MSVLPSRKALAAFVGVFLVGALVGAETLATYQTMNLPRFLVVAGDSKSMADRINKKYMRDYNLSPYEQTAIAPLTTEMAQHLYNIRRQFGVDIMATLDEYHQKIGEQMSPEHRAAYQQANEVKRKKTSAMLLLDQPATDAGQK